MPALPTQYLISRPEAEDLLQGLPVDLGTGLEVRLRSGEVPPQPALVQRLQAALLPIAELTVPEEATDRQPVTVQLPAGAIRAIQKLV